MADHTTRETARTAVEACEAVARWLWWEAKGAECPAEQLAAPLALATWLPECPEADRREAARCMDRAARALLAAPESAHLFEIDSTPRAMRPLVPPSIAQRFTVPAMEARARATFARRWLLTDPTEGGWFTPSDHPDYSDWDGDGDPPTVTVPPAVERLHALWLLARKHDPALRHPLAPLVAAWQRWRQAQGDEPDRVHVLVKQERRPPPGAQPLLLARMPGLLALTLAPLEAVEVDGEPLVSATPDARHRRYRVLPPEQGDLFPAPRTLDKRATGGALVEAVASAPLGGDERNPIRADLLRIGTLAYALTGSVRLTPGEVSILIVGSDTPQGRAQGLALVWLMRSIAIAPAGEPWAAFDAEPGAVHRIGPPRWWLDQTGPRAFRLVGALFRRIPGTGRKAARWGVLERTIAGIEGALLWGPSAGKGRSGRTPDAVRAVRRGGPGAPVTVAWHHLLTLAGEHVTPERLADPAKRDTLNRRFNRRIDALEAAGYMVGKNDAAAPTGDTIEIVARVKGGRHHEAAIVVRATARFCAAYATGAEQTRLPASHLLMP